MKIAFGLIEVLALLHIKCLLPMMKLRKKFKTSITDVKLYNE